MCKLLCKKQMIHAALVVVFLAVLLPLSYLGHVAEYQKKVRDTTIREFDLSKISDGVYTGEYNVDFIYAKTEVTVKDGRIEEIKLLEHKNGHGSPAEVIVDDILNEQKIDVDTISGATNSGIVIKKAVENAIEKGTRGTVLLAPPHPTSLRSATFPRGEGLGPKEPSPWRYSSVLYCMRTRMSWG